MATYFYLTCPTPAVGPDPALLTYLADDDARGWETGVPFSTDPMDFPEEQVPPLPVRFRISPEHAGALRELWEAPAPVMTHRLAAALRAGGVGNLHTYDAVIDDVPAGCVHTHYVAFNLVGLVQVQPRVHWVDPSVFGASPAPTPWLFRRRSQPYHLVIHERLRQHLDRSGFDMLRYSDRLELDG